MGIVELKLPHHHYRIVIEPGALEALGELVDATTPHRRAALFADENVLPLHGKSAQQSLIAAGYDVTVAPVPTGEKRKTLDTVATLYDVLLNDRLERRSPVIALGGGITGDTVGFVAATYLRGVPFVQCPTTLLAMVDASVGGKVGVNVKQGKNLIGAFHQPALVVADVRTLTTLPRRAIRCGLAECIKHAIIRDPALFTFLRDHLDAILALDERTLTELVRWNVQIKADVVMADEKESGDRAHLNFGHTFAHAIEATQFDDAGSDGKTSGDASAGSGASGGFEHGEAVALGMVAATRLAVDAGRVEASLLESRVALLTRAGLPVSAPDLPATEVLLNAMRLDKKVADDRIRLILPDRMGAVSMVNDTPLHHIEAAWNSLRH